MTPTKSHFKTQVTDLKNKMQVIHVGWCRPTSIKIILEYFRGYIIANNWQFFNFIRGSHGSGNLSEFAFFW